MKSISMCMLNLYSKYLLVTLCFLLTSCGGGGGNNSEPPGNNSGNQNSPPNISGSVSKIRVGNELNFYPSYSDADDDTLTFSIQGKPEWASFDSASGRLYGTP